MSSSGEILKKIDPIHYFEQFLPEGIYPDGRNTCQFRPLSVEMGVGWVPFIKSSLRCSQMLPLR
jgi:exosome complex RNA-binding protein Rrp42 (RNase PH superfamily)